MLLANVVVAAQSLNRVWFFVIPWTAARQASMSFTISWSLLKLMSIESLMPSNRLILCHPLVLPWSFLALGSFPVSQLFASRGQSIGVSASTSVLPVNIHNWFPLGWTVDLLEVQETLKSLLQHRSSKASIFRPSAFFIVQLSHPYVTTGKTIALTRLTFIDKVTSLLFHMLSRLVITFLPRSKRLLISCLQSPSAVILEPR